MAQEVELKRFSISGVEFRVIKRGSIIWMHWTGDACILFSVDSAERIANLKLNN